MPKLKDKRQEEFCQRYIIRFSGKLSAIGAGFSAKTAIVQASQLLTKPHIQKRIAELIKNRSERTQITQDMVLQELAVLGFSDFKNYGQVKEDGKLEFYPFKKIQEEKTRAINSIKEVTSAGGGRSISLKLHEKVRPLELVGKHLGMFVERHELAGEGGGPIKIDYVLVKQKKDGDGKGEKKQ